ncbi:MAG TPA: GGDEF domain-containing protein [Symbiobacteriaceae bacterium]|nr:GGDEF domain-containing protein [Symbiobacteriaceae bacterium]
MPGNSRPALLLAIGTMASATLIGVRTLSALGAVSGDQWFFFGVFTLLAALSYLFPIRLEGDDPVSYILSSAFLFAAVLLLPPGLVSIMCPLLVIPGYLRNRRRDRLLKDAFNAANYLLAAQASAWLIHIAGGNGHFGPVNLIAVLVAVAVNIGFSTVLVAGYLSLSLGISFRKSPVWDLRFLAADAMISAMGALLGIIAAVTPWAVILALIPLSVPYWLMRNIHLVHMVDVDPKTGLYNHRYFQKRLPDLLLRQKGRHRPLSVLFADLDYLREVNNTYGHLAGDQVLKQVADVLLQHTRPGDLLARWGGEEFVIVLPDSDPELALSVAQRLCEAIGNHSFAVGQAESIRCTMSIGVASAPDHGWDSCCLIHEADQAMYRAKAAGRNQACQA